MSDLTLTQRWIAEGLGDDTWTLSTYVRPAHGTKWHEVAYPGEHTTVCGRPVRPGATLLRDASILDIPVNRCRQCLSNLPYGIHQHKRVTAMFDAADTARNPDSTIDELVTAGADILLTEVNSDIEAAWVDKVGAEIREALADRYGHRPDWQRREATIARFCSSQPMPGGLNVPPGVRDRRRALVDANKDLLRDPDDTRVFPGRDALDADQVTAGIREWFEAVCADDDPLWVVSVSRLDDVNSTYRRYRTFDAAACFNWTGDQQRWILEVPASLAADLAADHSGTVIASSAGLGERLAPVAALFSELMGDAWDPFDDDQKALWATALRLT